jgi:hypothetical protein
MFFDRINRIDMIFFTASGRSRENAIPLQRKKAQVRAKRNKPKCFLTPVPSSGATGQAGLTGLILFFQNKLDMITSRPYN